MEFILRLSTMRLITLRHCVATLTLLAVFVSELSAADVDFAREILPILSDKCFVCHGPDAEEGFLRLDQRELAIEDLGGYRAIDPDDLAASHMIERIASEDDPMPPADADKQLTDAERDLLIKWIRGGAEYAKHWAFDPPTRSDPDATIDDFILAKIKERGFGYAEQAEREVLARRLALTLTGLPPEPQQVERFLSAEDFEVGYDALLSELFASPRYGEHQARYWLDAVRYGDTHGLHLDNRRGIYPYRDWVVRAFNENLPLDQFIEWQIAGDLLPNPTLQQLIATGFVRMNPSTSEGGAIAAEFQAKNNFDRTETFGTVLLGLSLTCARCHTHKYDPVTQTEYYELLAFFNSTAEGALDGNKYDYAPVVKVPQDQAAWSKLWKLKEQQAELLEAADAAVGQLPGQWASLSAKAKLDFLSGDFSPTKLGELKQRQIKITEELAELEKSYTTTLVAKELPKPRETRVLHRGEYDQPEGESLQPGVPAVIGSLGEDAPDNRLGLARWLTSREHPLVARVLVNRVWQRVFGYGLVRTPEDFGVQGQQPTHPELLDWLAVELQANDWDLQHMLRLMVQSRAFRQSSAWRENLDDPENKLFARGPSYRLDAEVIRDTALWASDLLDPQIGGEGVKPYQPDGMWKALAHPASNTKQYQRDKGAKLYRRSLYVYWKRTSPHPMMTIFDAPDRESSCVRRSRTNTSLQSLGLFNETQRIEMARKFAERLIQERDGDADRLRYAFQLLVCREPGERELKACLDLLAEMHARYSHAKDDAEKLLQQGDAGRNEELDVVELAAWTQVTSTLLASDLAILLN